MLRNGSVRLRSIPPAFTDTANTRSHSIRAADKWPQQSQQQLPASSINPETQRWVCLGRVQQRSPEPPPPPTTTTPSTMEDKEAAAGDQQPASELILFQTTIHPNISSGAAPTPRTCEETQRQKQKFCESKLTHSHTPSPPT